MYRKIKLVEGQRRNNLQDMDDLTGSTAATKPETIFTYHYVKFSNGNEFEQPEKHYDGFLYPSSL